MTATYRPPTSTATNHVHGTGRTTHAAPPATPSAVVRYAAAAARVSLGWIFLWAFVDKVFGLGHETKSAQAWIHGGSPTLGFLKMGAKGPFADFYHSIAGATWTNWLFMLGLAGIGIALVAGIAMRIAAALGAGRFVGLGGLWERLPIVQRFGFLK